MVGTMCSWEASGAASGVPEGCWEVNVAMDGNSGMSSGDMEAGVCDDGRNSRSGTCPPCWK
jgi:hypothetical protein